MAPQFDISNAHVVRYGDSAREMALADCFEPQSPILNSIAKAKCRFSDGEARECAR
jgi:hypothetical protein